MTICNICGDEMRNGGSCDDHELLLTSEDIIDAPRWGDSRYHDSFDMPDQCPDCGVELGGVHHSMCRLATIPHDEVDLNELDQPTKRLVGQVEDYQVV